MPQKPEPRSRRGRRFLSYILTLARRFSWTARAARGEIEGMTLTPIVRCLVALMVLVATACGGGGGASNQCHGLELADCRDTSGCVVDSCDLCTCTPTYRGCLASFETPTACPAVGCAHPECCAEANDCESTTACAPPGTAFGCGSCNAEPGNCTDDAGCKAQGAAMICEPVVCTCTDQKACTQGCIQDSTCAEGQACDLATARCVARACDATNGCPPDFDCTATGCARRTCTDDLACDGYCVLGECFTGRGECRPPSA